MMLTTCGEPLGDGRVCGQPIPITDIAAAPRTAAANGCPHSRTSDHSTTPGNNQGRTERRRLGSGEWLALAATAR
jgi:hypothetical protein